MDYEATDKYMSSYVVSCEKNGTRFYLTDEGYASDILGRARIFRWLDQAEAETTSARAEYAWQGFPWEVLRVPAVYAQR